VLLGRELLQQVLVGGVGGAVLACGGQPLAQAMLVGEEEPHLAAPALGNAWGNRRDHSIQCARRSIPTRARTVHIVSGPEALTLCGVDFMSNV